MIVQPHHTRHRSHFKKGMTLEQYLLQMQFTEQAHAAAEDTTERQNSKQECLYKTSYNFYQGADPRPQLANPLYGEYVGEIMNVNCRNNSNINSGLLRPSGKKQPKRKDQGEEIINKGYRIRNGKSVSPYHGDFAPQSKNKSISPYLNPFKKPRSREKCDFQRIQRDQGQKSPRKRALFAKQGLYLEFKKPSNKDLSTNFKKYSEDTRQCERLSNQILLNSQKIQSEAQKLYFRVETLKQRLQNKRRRAQLN